MEERENNSWSRSNKQDQYLLFCREKTIQKEKLEERGRERRVILGAGPQKTGSVSTVYIVVENKTEREIGSEREIERGEGGQKVGILKTNIDMFALYIRHGPDEEK